MKPYFTIKIESKSMPGDFHDVDFYKNGTTHCGCKRNSYYKMHCSHIDQAISNVAYVLDKSIELLESKKNND